jgi:trans-2,3-dihydro-3-hydroxyanthranilate isomerase
MRKFPFVTVDVFSTRALEGNPVAVFTDARGLSDVEMQAIALETRLSGTMFVVPRDAVTERASGIKVRIFTVAEELPFAGHPTLGTATVIAGARKLTEVALDLKVGEIPVSFKTTPDGLFGEMTQRDPEFGQIHDAHEIARVTAIPAGEINTAIPIQTVSTGFAFAIVPLRSLASLGRLGLDLTRAYAYLATTDARQFYFVTRETNGEPGLRARMLFYSGEDPATGSAAGCTAA